MADEADLAQDLNDQHLARSLEAQRNRVREIPICGECEERHCFITPQGTITRICKVCYAEKIAARA